MTYPMQSLSALGSIRTGSTPLTAEDKFWGGDYPFVTPAELDQSLPITSTPRTLSEDGAAQSRLLQEGTVMVCCIGSLGKIGIAGRSVVTNQQINSIEFDVKIILPRYGYYACQRLKPKLLSMAPATTIPIVSKSKFGQLEIPVPPLPEQRRIAAILDQADALRAKRREALAQLDHLTQSIFIEMFGDPPYGDPNWLGVSLSDVTDTLTGYAFRSEEYVGEEPNAIKLCRGTNVLPRRIDWSETAWWPKEKASCLEAFQLAAGDIVLAMDRPWISEGFKISQIAQKDCPSLLVQRVTRIRGDERAMTAFIFHLLNQPAFTRHCKPTETTVPHISPNEIRSYKFRLPPLSVQAEFCTRISAVDDLIEKSKEALQETDALFASLQHRAFRGEL